MSLFSVIPQLVIMRISIELQLALKPEQLHSSLKLFIMFKYSCMCIYRNLFDAEIDYAVASEVSTAKV